MSHTKAPWQHKGTGIEARAFDGSWKWITPVVHGGNPTEATANRALIAAAPDLLAALKQIVDHFGDPLQVAHAAIAKAEGR